MMGGYYGIGMWSGALLMVLFWLAMIVLAIWGLRALFPGGRSAQATAVPSPLDVVQMRYSRGELSRDEYLALVEDLKHTKETGNDTAA